jgi:hypothetical protein
MIVKQTTKYLAVLAAILVVGCATHSPNLSGKWVTPTMCGGTVLFLGGEESQVDGLGYTWTDVGPSYRYFRVTGKRSADHIVLTKHWINCTDSETQAYVVREEIGMGLSLVNTNSDAGLPDGKFFTDTFVRPVALE